MSESKTYAIIQLAGKQHLVHVGDQLKVNALSQDANTEFKTEDVLLVKTDKDAQIGQPLVKGVSVTLKVVENKKDKKIRVAKFKAKSRYRKVYGHRQPVSLLEVVSINA